MTITSEQMIARAYTCLNLSIQFGCFVLMHMSNAEAIYEVALNKKEKKGKRKLLQIL